MRAVILVPVLLVLATLTNVKADTVNVASNLIKNNSIGLYYISEEGEDLATLQTFKSAILDETWLWAGAIINPSAGPSWAENVGFREPNINVLKGDQIRVYFTAPLKIYKSTCIGVAFAPRIVYNGYQTLSSPLIGEAGSNLGNPSLIVPGEERPNSTPLLVYTNITVGHVEGQSLTEDGLFTAGSSVKLLQPTQEWEAGVITKAWGFERNGFFYIFYLGMDEVTVGVSRSAELLGPYEKQAQPIATLTKARFAKNNLERDLIWGEDGWPYLKR